MVPCRVGSVLALIPEHCSTRKHFSSSVGLDWHPSKAPPFPQLLETIDVINALRHLKCPGLLRQFALVQQMHSTYRPRWLEGEMGTRAELFTESMLPRSRPPWRSVVTSLAVQAAAVVAILTLSYSVVKSAETESRSYRLTYLKTDLAPLKHVHLKTGNATPAPRTPVGDVQLPEQPKRPAFHPKVTAPVLKKSAQLKLVSVPEIESPLLPVPTASEWADTKGPRKPREEVRTGTFGNEGTSLVAGTGGNG